MALLLKAKALLQHSPQLVELNYSLKRLAGHVAGFTTVARTLQESAFAICETSRMVYPSVQDSSMQCIHLIDTFAQFSQH